MQSRFIPNLNTIIIYLGKILRFSKKYRILRDINNLIKIHFLFELVRLHCSCASRLYLKDKGSIKFFTLVFVLKQVFVFPFIRMMKCTENILLFSNVDIKVVIKFWIQFAHDMVDMKIPHCSTIK